MGRLFKHLQQGYLWLMQRLLKKPALAILGVTPLLILGYIAFHQVGSGFMPHMDEGGFILDYRAPAGTSLTETDRLLQQVEAIVRANPAVESYSRRTGAQLGGGLTEASEGDFFVRLKALPRPPIDQLMDDVRGRIETKVPGPEVEMALLMEDLIGDLTAVPQPIATSVAWITPTATASSPGYKCKKPAILPLLYSCAARSSKARASSMSYKKC